MRKNKSTLPLTICSFLPIVFGIIALIVSLFTVTFYYLFLPKIYAEKFPEIVEIQNKKADFNELKEYFENLANKKGAVYAYDVLKVSPLPPNIDLHLLGHVIGDILYQQQGVNGMKYCTQDFRNACSHTVAVGLFLDEGDAALAKIAKACEKAPGGKGAYTMCYHGLGHGVLAYTNYNLVDAVALCKKAGTPERNNREYAECVGGIIMEQISGGDHDKQTWEKQRQINLKTENPLYPCNSRIIEGKQAKAYCYLYLTPHIFNSSGLVVSGRPGEETIARAFTVCNKIEQNDGYSRESCYGGFGKEFAVLAKDRDIRKMDQLSGQEIAQIYSWCGLADNIKGQQYCIKYAMNSIYWGGENSRNGAVAFCNQASDNAIKNYCFTELISSVGFYNDSPAYRKEFCSEIPVSMQSLCQSKLL